MILIDEKATSNARLDTLMNSKIYVNNSGITFPGTAELLGPFLDTVKPENVYQVVTENEVQNKNEDGTLNISYPRVLVQAKIHSFNSELQLIAGLVYNMDKTNPVIKTYLGVNVSACLNMCVFNAAHISEKSLMTDFGPVYDLVDKMDDTMDLEVTKNYIDNLHEKSLSITETRHLFGSILMQTMRKSSKIPSSLVTNAASLLVNDSPYTIKNDRTTMWNIYNSFTDGIKTTPILTQPDKSLMFYNILRTLSRN